VTLAQELLPERKCHKCTLNQKQRWGCTEDAPGAPIVMDGRELKRCPNRPLLDFPVFYNELFKLQAWYGKGHLPDGGTWLDQSNVFVECVSIIESAQHEASKIKDAKQKRMRDLGKNGAIP
tara:strand:- start:412 stop:774 length:363 start_codon:yes stop_codon:yes gene_type:complete